MLPQFLRTHNPVHNSAAAAHKSSGNKIEWKRPDENKENTDESNRNENTEIHRMGAAELISWVKVIVEKAKLIDVSNENNCKEITDENKAGICTHDI